MPSVLWDYKFLVIFNWSHSFCYLLLALGYSVYYLLFNHERILHTFCIIWDGPLSLNGFPSVKSTLPSWETSPQTQLVWVFASVISCSSCPCQVLGQAYPNFLIRGFLSEIICKFWFLDVNKLHNSIKGSVTYPVGQGELTCSVSLLFIELFVSFLFAHFWSCLFLASLFVSYVF